MKVLPKKDYREIVPITFDFAADAATGATATPGTITVAALRGGTDATPSAVLNGAASATGATVTQWVKDGVSGITYKITCVAAMSDGQTLVQTAQLTVVTA